MQTEQSDLQNTLADGAGHTFNCLVICGEARMRGQAGFWDVDERYVRLSEAGDPLEKLNALVPWEVFRQPLTKALKAS